MGYGTPTGGGNLYIFSTSTPDKQAAAWRWIQYLSSPEIQADWSAKTGYIAARQSAWELDPLKSLVEEHPQYAVARDQLQYADQELATHQSLDCAIRSARRSTRVITVSRTPRRRSTRRRRKPTRSVAVCWLVTRISSIEKGIVQPGKTRLYNALILFLAELD